MSLDGFRELLETNALGRVRVLVVPARCGQVTVLFYGDPAVTEVELRDIAGDYFPPGVWVRFLRVSHPALGQIDIQDYTPR